MLVPTVISTFSQSSNASILRPLTAQYERYLSRAKTAEPIKMHLEKDSLALKESWAPPGEYD